MKTALVNPSTAHDLSGKLVVSLYSATSPAKQQAHVEQTVMVPDDMVCIGGGAATSEYQNGALLTASHPNDDLSGWVASSKDHLVADPHRLTTYAIGLSVEGLSRQELLDLDLVTVTSAESGEGDHVEATATVEHSAAYALVGGGFRVDWAGAGSLATASCPQGAGWVARAKDHGEPAPARVRAYAVALCRQLPGIGTVATAIAQATSQSAAHPEQVVDVPGGYALCGAGAEVHWEHPGAQGNLLHRIAPAIGAAEQSVDAGSKDHVQPSPATLTAYAVGIRAL